MGCLSRMLYLCGEAQIRVTNKVANALCWRKTLLTRKHIEVPGFNSFCELLASDSYFSGVLDRVRDGEETDFLLHDSFLFNGNQLCILDCILRP